MSRSYTHVHLGDVEDVAPANGFGDRWEAHVARALLKAQQTDARLERTRVIDLQ